MYGFNTFFFAFSGYVIFLLTLLAYRSSPFSSIFSWKLANSKYNPFSHDVKSLVYVLIAIILLLLPLWIEIGVTNSGFYTLFFNPLEHLPSREQSLKLADTSLSKYIYLQGIRLAEIVIPVALLYSLKIRSIILFIISILTMVFANIQGSRSLFFMPFIISLLIAYFCDLNFMRTYINTSFSRLLTFKIPHRLIQKSILACIGISLIFGLFYLVSLRRVNREIDTLLLNKLLISIVGRVFGVPVMTGIQNIFAIEYLDLPVSYMFGGFPGTTLLFGAREPLFMVTGSFLDDFLYGRVNSSVNANCSALYVMVAFIGPVLGSIWFFILQLLQLYLIFPFRLMLRSVQTLFGFNLSGQILVFLLVSALSNSSLDIIQTSSGLFGGLIYSSLAFLALGFCSYMPSLPFSCKKLLNTYVP
ncbi:hypothetical protein [Synechococcus sp. MIT S9509]|uniref:hypothetical protein n=1 Tax=Synechococcus sp. MIT S9509 TaxID=1801630 RepID=UPI001E52989F|nr:hypothetical protein [Synechococcus sp. MIT S9509]